MPNNRITWNGNTSQVSFIFDFLCDEEPNPNEFPPYDNFESQYPGKIKELEDFYYQNKEQWKSNELVLSEDQIMTLQVMIDCVNFWHRSEFEFFQSMDTHKNVAERIKLLEVDNPEKARNLRIARRWWQRGGGNDSIEFLQDRTEDHLGEDSYLYQFLCSKQPDEVFGVFYNFFASEAPYDYETIGLITEDDLEEISEDEVQEMGKFLAENHFLLDFLFSSRFFHKHPGSEEFETDEITYTEIPIEQTEEGDDITVIVTCATCGSKEYDQYPDFCPGCGWAVNYQESE
jgi:hypothetical protein